MCMILLPTGTDLGSSELLSYFRRTMNILISQSILVGYFDIIIDMQLSDLNHLMVK